MFCVPLFVERDESGEAGGILLDSGFNPVYISVVKRERARDFS